jgi:hypothetical protein
MARGRQILPAPARKTTTSPWKGSFPGSRHQHDGRRRPDRCVRSGHDNHLFAISPARVPGRATAVFAQTSPARPGEPRLLGHHLALPAALAERATPSMRVQGQGGFGKVASAA